MTADRSPRIGVVRLAADLLSGWPEEPWSPGFAEGAAVRAACDAMQTSAASGRWVSIGDVLASPL